MTWLQIGQNKWIMIADWLEEVGHGSRLVRVNGSWLGALLSSYLEGALY